MAGLLNFGYAKSRKTSHNYYANDSAILYGIVYCIVLYMVLYCTLHCIVLYIVLLLYCIVLPGQFACQNKKSSQVNFLAYYESTNP